MSNTNHIVPYSTQLALPMPNPNGSFKSYGICYGFSPYDDSFVMLAMLWAVVATGVLNYCFKPTDPRDLEIERLKADLAKAHTDYELLEEELVQAECDRLQAYELSCKLTQEYMNGCLEKESTESTESTTSSVSSSPPASTLADSICTLLKQKKSTARNLFVELLPTNPGLIKSDVNSCLYKLKARSITTFTQGPKKSPVWSLC